MYQLTHSSHVFIVITMPASQCSVITVTRIHRWDGTTVYVATLPDQTIDGSLIINMPFDKTRLEEFMQDIYPRILRWCAGRCHESQLSFSSHSTRVQPAFNPRSTRVQPVFNLCSTCVQQLKISLGNERSTVEFSFQCRRSTS